ncbi:MAG: sugar isomerase domain-containing protein [Acidimicrobiia bacterium]
MTRRDGVAGSWIARGREILDFIETEQMVPISEAAAICASAIGGGGLVHLFGTGHSRIPIEEMFPRYGSFPGFNPIAELSMTFHTQVVGANGQRQAMFIERVEGLGEVILSNFSYDKSDAFMVFSAGGRSAVPIEVAQGARDRGMPVIVVTSVAESLAGEPSHSTGTRLLDHGDVVIDIGTPPGDGLVRIPGLDTPVGPGSTLANAAIVNEIKVQTAEILLDRELMPPVLTAASVVGPDRSTALFDAAYAEHARRVSRAIDPGSHRENPAAE